MEGAGTSQRRLVRPAGQAGVDDVRMHPVWLTFDEPGCERSFRRAYDRASLPIVRAAGFLGVALFVIFSILDEQVVPAESGELLLLRLGIAAPYIAIAVVMTYRPWFWRVQQPVVASVALVSCWALAAMPVVAPVPDSWTPMAMMIGLMFLFGLTRVRFPLALITAILIVIGFEASMLLTDVSGSTLFYNNFMLFGVLTPGIVAGHTLERLWRRDFLRALELERERERSDALLHNVLPETIARRLRTGSGGIAEAADEVAVLFADIVGFTPLAERSDPRTLVAFLDRLFVRYDELCDLHGAEKIKTIGDAYMAVTGVPDRHPDPAGAIAELALGIRDATAAMEDDLYGAIEVRIGISSGPVVAGVIGRRKFAYDLWGDTVNTASRMESHARPGAIQVCGTTRRLLGERYRLAGPRMVEVKGKGSMTTWELVGRSDEHVPPAVGTIAGGDVAPIAGALSSARSLRAGRIA